MPRKLILFVLALATPGGFVALLGACLVRRWLEATPGQPSRMPRLAVALTLALCVIFSASPVRAAHHDIGIRSTLKVDGPRWRPRRPPPRDRGALLGRPVQPQVAEARPAVVDISLPQSFVQFHSNRVRHDLALFHPQYLGLEPPVHLAHMDPNGPASRLGAAFVPPPRTADALAFFRMRDRILLFRTGERADPGLGAGVGMFGAMVLLSAHAPGPLRALFDHRVHLGPAVFEDGGMGIAVGSTWM